MCGTMANGGNMINQVAPVVVSASRATDIPAFYAEWFFRRLEAEYCAWVNPFNQRKMYVSFKNCRVVVFWSKNPEPILPCLHKLDERGIHYYFQFTLNDYEQEGFEPNVPELERRIETFRKLSGMIGKERVIWRFDPLIVTPSLSTDMLLARIERIGDSLKGCTEKLVFSFVDVKAYRKVQSNLVKETGCFTKCDVMTAEPDDAQRVAIIKGLASLRDKWESEGWNISLATCAEGIDFSEYVIGHNRCIDGELIERLFGSDYELRYYLHTGKLPEPDLFGAMPPVPEAYRNLKDKGQRKACGCMASKDIGMYNTCRHFCAYCYANASREIVMRNAERHSPDSESLI